MLARRILARQHGGEPRDRGHHRRRADRPLRGRPGRVQLPADAPDDPGDAPRGPALHASDGITINTFMLERSRALAEFVALVTRLNRGRAFYATPERLGEYVLVDFVSAARTRQVCANGRGTGCSAAPLRRPRRGVPARGAASDGASRAVDVPICSCSCTSWARSSRSGRVRVPDHRRDGWRGAAARELRGPRSESRSASSGSIPLAIFQGITGVGLILVTGINLLDAACGSSRDRPYLIASASTFFVQTQTVEQSSS